MHWDGWAVYLRFYFCHELEGYTAFLGHDTHSFLCRAVDTIYDSLKNALSCVFEDEKIYRDTGCILFEIHWIKKYGFFKPI
jgi:hypothetical protein